MKKVLLFSIFTAQYWVASVSVACLFPSGCSLLILNVLIFAGVYYQRDKTRMEVKSLQQQQQRNQANFEAISKHSHYQIGHSQSSSVIVEVEHDTSAMIMAANQPQDLSVTKLPNALKAPPPSPNVISIQTNCMTLPKNATTG